MKLYRMNMSTAMGRELVADIDIHKGEVLCVCEILLLSEDDTKIVEATSLKYYTFKVSNTQDCLVLGDGEIFNHSDTPNVRYDLTSVDGRLMMVFSALRCIEPNEQLFIDYSADSNINVSEYLNKKSLVG